MSLNLYDQYSSWSAQLPSFGSMELHGLYINSSIIEEEAIMEPNFLWAWGLRCSIETNHLDIQIINYKIARNIFTFPMNGVYASTMGPNISFENWVTSKIWRFSLIRIWCYVKFLVTCNYKHSTSCMVSCCRRCLIHTNVFHCQSFRITS